MESADSLNICPIEKAGALDNNIRRFLQNPNKLLSPYIRKNMTVLDFGCGPGFFTIEIARLLEGTGKVIAADLQQGMLDKIQKKITGSTLEKQIELHRCSENGIGLTKNVDFALAFYVVHEVPIQYQLFNEIKVLLKPDGKLLIVEPKFHVTKKKFEIMKNKLLETGFSIIDQPSFSFSRALLLGIY